MHDTLRTQLDHYSTRLDELNFLLAQPDIAAEKQIKDIHFSKGPATLFLPVPSVPPVVADCSAAFCFVGGPP